MFIFFRYIPHDSRFCNALLTRGYTVNLPEKDFTLMPLRMSSLLSFQQPPSAPTPKLGITVAMRLHKDGHVLGYKVMPSSVKNFINTTYQEMDSVLLGVEESKLTNTAKILRQRYAQHLQRLEFFAERRRRLRAKRDAIIKSVPTHDVELRRDARDGSKAEVRIRINSDPFANARGIMTEFDILVNEIVADYGNKQVRFFANIRIDAYHRVLPCFISVKRKFPLLSILPLLKIRLKTAFAKYFPFRALSYRCFIPLRIYYSFYIVVLTML